MKLENILNELKGIGNTGMSKTASVKGEEKAATTANKEAAAKDELVQAIDNALNKPTSTKTASEDKSAAAELVKMAGDLASAEQESLVKQAHLYGAAVADGFVARMQQHSASAVKVAQDQEAIDKDGFNKFAAENPELVKQAMELGYRDGVQQIEMLKQAAAQEKQAAFERGYTDTLSQLQKHAAALESDGQDKTAAFQAGYADAVKTAQQGYNDTINEAVKIASDCVERGYNDTMKVLKSL